MNRKQIRQRNQAVKRLNVKVTREDRRSEMKTSEWGGIFERAVGQDLNDGFRVKGGPTERVAPLRFADRVTANDPRA